MASSDNGLKTQSSKVHPSPGAARSVWALPLTASCNMVGVEHDHHQEEEEPEEDGKDMLLTMMASNSSSGHSHQLLRAADGTELELSVEDVFDVIKNG